MKAESYFTAAAASSAYFQIDVGVIHHERPAYRGLAQSRQDFRL